MRAAITPDLPSSSGPAPDTSPSGPTVDFQLPLDLDLALEPSLIVPGRANIPTLWANLTTDASQWEPGEFSNGLWAWSPNVFGLHNAGVSLGSAQRSAYIEVASQAPYTLMQFQVQVDTNATGSSAANPVVIAVEWSSTNSFVSYSTLGTVQSHRASPQILALSQPIPAGLTYIRLRATSQVPDGSNYIAYSKIVLAGSIQSSSTTGSISVLNPMAKSPATADDIFSLTYDFKHASDKALLVGVAAPVQNGLISLLATNALQFEPGEFNNGVTSFGSEKVFILHRGGAAIGQNQRYPYAVIATQQALIVSSVTANFSSNASGASLSDPVVVSIEGSTSPDFTGAVTLGSLSSVTSTCVTSTLLLKGVSYLRLRCITPIPDDSNYIAFSSISIFCFKI